MQVLTFPKAFLLEKLRENRARHEEIFDEAMVSYREEVLEGLEGLSETLNDKIGDLVECLDTTRSNEDKTESFRDYDFSVSPLYLTKPSNHLIDYDRTILMIKNCQQGDIELSQQEYSQYVMDNWDWQQSFMTSNSSHSAVALSGCVSMGY